MREVRLGDDIDDYCIRCKRVMNHAVVSVMNGEAAKVRCRTCHSDHDFRHEQPPPPKVDARKAALFNEVLKKVDPAAGEAVSEADLAAVPAVEDLGEDPPVEEEAAAAEVAAEAAAEAPAPKAKPKTKGRKK
jgi:hypothetical protein